MQGVTCYSITKVDVKKKITSISFNLDTRTNTWYTRMVLPSLVFPISFIAMSLSIPFGLLSFFLFLIQVPHPTN